MDERAREFVSGVAAAPPGTGRPMPFTIRQLQMFVAVAEAGTISRAAERLYVSETAISLAVGQLERALGAKLLERRRAHGATLTSAGQTVLASARRVLGEADELYEEMSGAGTLAGTVTAGCFLTLGPTLMPGLVQRFGAEHPRATLRFRESLPRQLHEELDRGIIDLMFTFDLRVSPELARVTLYEMRPVVLLAADHPAASGTGPIRLEDLAEDPFILLDNEISEDHSREICRRAGFEPRIALRSQNFETVRAFVGRGFGWAINVTRPWSTASYEGREVVAREIADPVPGVAVLAAWPPDRPLSRTARAVVELARELTGDQAEDRVGDRAGRGPIAY